MSTQHTVTMKRQQAFLGRVLVPIILMPVLSLGQGDAQRTPRDSVVLSNISGRVFVVGKGGEVWPARSAAVYLIYFYDPDKKGREGLKTAGFTFQKEDLRALKKVNKNLKAQKGELSEAEKKQLVPKACQMLLQSTDQALSATVKWAEEHQKPWQVKRTTTDKEGLWSLPNLNPGEYAIVVRGSTGQFDVHWQGDLVLRPGESIFNSLSAAKTACPLSD